MDEDDEIIGGKTLELASHSSVMYGTGGDYVTMESIREGLDPSGVVTRLEEELQEVKRYGEQAYLAFKNKEKLGDKTLVPPPWIEDAEEGYVR